ncbi:uncharacterized protein LOC131929822 [Physella acuta]|uniref:uncharacterized protein LOC131929822 n=1 Tax=Physella acuta TaxID=109671 RepID=UPI0027DB8A5F|nr:uncharacterized protein LOC131929822 [Physella acuta]
MPEPRYGIRSKLLVLSWLLILSVIGVVKIVVGSISADGGCLGLYLLPYYHLLGGILSLLPAIMSLLVSFCGQTKNLRDVWCLMANVLFVSFLLIFSGTIYVITNTVRVTNLDRLCTHTWVPIFSLCSLAVDWLLIFFLL